jgi:hypothetical protein
MSQQPRLDVLRFKRLSQQWVIEQINLPYREIIRRAPIGIEVRQFLPVEDSRPFCFNRCFFLHSIGLSFQMALTDLRPGDG